MDDDLRYKEYKAQIPPKWAEFDQTGVPKSKRKFTAFLSSSQRAHSQLATGSSGGDDWDDAAGTPAADGATDSAGGGSKKKKRSWMEEMVSYCKEQEQRAAAKEKAQQLENELRRRQEKANAQKEHISSLIPGLKVRPATTSGDESTLSGAGGRGRKAAPANETICAAQEIETSLFASKFEARLQQRYESGTKKLAKKLTIIDEKQKHVESNNQARSQYIHEVTDKQERDAAKRVVEQEEKKFKHLMDQMKESESRARDLEVRVKIARDALVQRREALRKEIDARVASRMEQREAHRLAFEKQMEELFDETNRRLQASKLEREILLKEDRVGKALQRAAEERKAQRQAQLASCEKSELHRLHVQKEKEANDADYQQQLRARNESRESRAASRIAKIRDASINESMSIIKKSHARSPSPAVNGSSTSMSSLNESSVVQDVIVHLNRVKDKEEERLEKALEMELKEYEKHQSVVRQQQQHLQELHAKGVEADLLRAERRERALRAKQEVEDKIAKAAAVKQAKADKLIAELREEIRVSTQTANAEKVQKAMLAIQQIQFTQRQELLAAVAAKERATEAKAAAREEQHARELERAQAEREQRWEATTAHIAMMNQQRDERLQQNIERKDQQRVHATIQREDAMLAMQKKLKEQADAHSAQLREAERLRHESFVKKHEKAIQKDSQWEASREAQARAEREYRSQIAEVQERHLNEVHQRLDKSNTERLVRNVEKLQRVYSQGSAQQQFTPPRRPNSVT